MECVEESIEPLPAVYRCYGLHCYYKFADDLTITCLLKTQNPAHLAGKCTVQGFFKK